MMGEQDELTKSNVRHIVGDLPGSLGDQQDPVHLFHLAHPESDGKGNINIKVGHWCYLTL